MSIQISIRGFLVGPLWMPGVEGFTELNYDVTREALRYSPKATLRDHVLAATNCGDFQSCSIAQGELVATRTWRKGNLSVTRSRAYPLAKFPSIADCLHDEPEWLPDCEGEA